MGVLSAVPPVSMGNACCCLWVISGGIVAAYLLQQKEPAPITAGDGAWIGLLAGLTGALIVWGLSIPIALLLAPMDRQLGEIADRARNMPPEMREFLRRFQGGQYRAAWLMASLIGWLFVGAIFSTLGGMLGVVIFRKKLPPGGTVDATPSR